MHPAWVPFPSLQVLLEEVLAGEAIRHQTEAMLLKGKLLWVFNSPAGRQCSILGMGAACCQVKWCKDIMSVLHVWSHSLVNDATCCWTTVI
jgi:hypothetical protein